jgi:hypothetical protein
VVTLEELLLFYNDKYVPAYSEMVGYTGDKPAQVLVEFENMAVHLIKFLDKGQPDNLEKAYNHLVRVTIDCYKILWIEIKEDIASILKNPRLIESLSVTGVEFYPMVALFKEQGTIARKSEVQNTGTKPTTCLEEYAKAIYLGWDIIKCCGPAYKDILAAKPVGGSIAGEMPPDSY